MLKSPLLQLLAAILCAGMAASCSGGAAGPVVPSGALSDVDAASCSELAQRIANLEQAGVPAKLARANETKTPLAASDQADADAYLEATAAHLDGCSGAGSH